MFAKVLETPAVHPLLDSAEKGGVLSWTGVTAAAQPFITALLRARFPDRTLVVVTDQLKTQESFQQDLTTWVDVLGTPAENDTAQESPTTAARKPMFFPSWEMLPQESRLPHVDVIGDRLETLISLASPQRGPTAPLIVASVTALLQRTFPQPGFTAQLRLVQKGEVIEPLDLIEWLEDRGYEPEAQVTQKGEIALRGGIVDIFPLTSPWPVRLEFFGDELESLRFFDPLTQISREEISSVVIPPAGELGLLKRNLPDGPTAGIGSDSTAKLGTLLDYLGRDTLLVCCEPALLQVQAEEYERQVPQQYPLFITWRALQDEARAKGITIIKLADTDAELENQAQVADFDLQSLEAFRPLAERPPDPQIAQEQRREFFAQIHRWLRQDYAVYLFCNNDGERQRFLEIWNEYGLEETAAAIQPADNAHRQLTVRLGSLARGFLSEQARLVVVTDAEIFGR
ncbi:MAG TPA: transcription-repair coupling factor, partial [Patescibacteria group bacterium]|nr:transcription-repair coupling factor [Patescibacteria group bacterium]